MGSYSSGTKNGGTKPGALPPDYVPLYTRIKRLRRRAGLSMLFWKVVPCVLVLAVVTVIMGSSIPSPIWGFYLVLVIAFPFSVGFWIAQTAANNVYLATSSYMYQTNLPILVADELCCLQFHSSKTSSIAGKLQKIIQPKDALQQLVLSSTHNSLLREFLVGNSNYPQKMAIDSSCLWLSGTWLGQALLITTTGLAVTSTCGCVFIFPVWGYFLYTLFCRQAALMAVCDYFLGTPQVKMHKLNNVGRFFVESVATQDHPEEVGLLPPQ